MRIVKAVFSQLTLLLLWVMGCLIFWGWIFTFLTDTTPDKKITLYIDAPVQDATSLAVRLEEALPEGLKMVKVYPFTHAMLNGDALRTADLYIVKSSDLAGYGEWFTRQLPQDMQTHAEDGMIPVHKASENNGLLQAYIQYEAGEDYYLLFGASSLHVAGNPGSTDNAAIPVAEMLLSMP